MLKLFNITYDQFKIYQPPIDSVLSASRVDDEIVIEISEQWWHDKLIQLQLDIQGVIDGGIEHKDKET